MFITRVKFLDEVRINGQCYMELAQGQDGVVLDIPNAPVGYVRLRYVSKRDDGEHKCSLLIPRERTVNVFGEEDVK
jgi:hypothetical protein